MGTMLDAFRKPAADNTAGSPASECHAAGPLDALDELLQRDAANAELQRPALSAPALAIASAPSCAPAPSANGTFDSDTAAVEAINAEYMVTRINGEAVIMREGTDPDTGSPTIEPISQPAFRLALANKHVYEPTPGGSIRRVNAARVWLESPRRREYPGGLTLCPPGTPVPPGSYNMWRGWGVAPVEGDPTPMVDHIRILCGRDAVAADYSLKFLAWCAQNPGKRAEVALVYRGGQGVGKGTVFNATLQCFGAHGLHLTQRSQLTGRFNSHLRRALFVFSDEALFAGDREAEGQLKALITEPTVLIEQKGVDPVQVPNRTKHVFASNNDWVVPAGADERRVCVVQAADTKAGDLDYFNNLHRWLDNGGLGAWLHFLLHLDLGNFDVRRFPRTKALTEQKIATMTPLDRWLLNALDTGTSLTGNGAWCGDERLGCSVACEAFKAYCDRSSMRAQRVDARAIGIRLHQVFACGPAAGGGASGGKRWHLPPLPAARERATVAFGLGSYEWGSDEHA
jgi:hypothetical protein